MIIPKPETPETPEFEIFEGVYLVPHKNTLRLVPTSHTVRGFASLPRYSNNPILEVITARLPTELLVNINKGTPSGTTLSIALSRARKNGTLPQAEACILETIAGIRRVSTCVPLIYLSLHHNNPHQMLTMFIKMMSFDGIIVENVEEERAIFLVCDWLATTTEDKLEHFAKEYKAYWHEYVTSLQDSRHSSTIRD